MIITRKAMRALAAMMPRWMLAVFAACVLVPGPFDELAALFAALVLCAIQPIRARRAASAWRGGKSHRGQES